MELLFIYMIRKSINSKAFRRILKSFYLLPHPILQSLKTKIQAFLQEKIPFSISFK